MGYISIFRRECVNSVLLSFWFCSIHVVLSESSWVQVTNSTRTPKTGNTILCPESHVTCRVRERKRVASQADTSLSLVFSVPNQGQEDVPKLWVESGERKPPLLLKEGQERGLVLLGKGGPSCSRAAPPLPWDTSLQAMDTPS